MTNLALFQMNLHCNFSFYTKIFHKTKSVILRVTSIYMDLHIEDDLIGPELQITNCIFKNPLFCNKNFEVLLYHYIENEKLN